MRLTDAAIIAASPNLAWPSCTNGCGQLVDPRRAAIPATNGTCAGCSSRLRAGTADNAPQYETETWARGEQFCDPGVPKHLRRVQQA